MPTSSDRPAATAGYFATDRCFASIEVKRDTFVPCILKYGHAGEHEPWKPSEQTTDEPSAAYLNERRSA